MIPVKIKIMYDYSKPTANGRIYSEKVLKEAFNSPAFKELCEHKEVPILDDRYNILGVAEFDLNKQEVTGYGEIFNPSLIDAIRTNPEKFAVTLAGSGNFTYNESNEFAIIDDFKISHASFMDKSSCGIANARIEVLDEN